MQSNHRKLPAYGQIGVECLVDVAKIYVAVECTADEFANVAEFRDDDGNVAARILAITRKISWEYLLGRELYARAGVRTRSAYREGQTEGIAGILSECSNIAE